VGDQVDITDHKTKKTQEERNKKETPGSSWSQGEVKVERSERGKGQADLSSA